MKDLRPATEMVVSYEEAAAIVRLHAARAREGRLAGLGVESVALGNAAGRVLAAPTVADRDQPPFDRATRDGYAARASDWMASDALVVAGMVRAGERWNGVVNRGEALEIMTGAPMPAGADCVVMVEHIARDGERVRLEAGRKIETGENVVPAGAEARANATLIPAGTRIHFGQVAVAAACGYATVDVFQRPRVAVVTTGDELVEIDQQPLSHQIRNSNSYSLAAQIAACGASVEPAIARDELKALSEALDNALSADLLVLSGGVSMGRYDLVEEALHARGAEFFFTGVRIQPGKPVVFGRLPLEGGSWQYFFGLPGNPVSTMVTFALFVAPLLRALGGEEGGEPRFAMAKLMSPMRVKTGLTRFLPAEMGEGKLTPELAPIKWQGSGDLSANARANCYVVVPPDRELLEAGETVSVLLG